MAYEHDICMRVTGKREISGDLEYVDRGAHLHSAKVCIGECTIFLNDLAAVESLAEVASGLLEEWRKQSTTQPYYKDAA